MVTRKTDWYDLSIVVGIIAMALMLLAGGAWAEPHEEWTSTFGGSSNDEAYSVQQTSDGGYIVAGTSESYAWLMKTDASGNELWDKTYGGKGSAIARSIRQTSDGGYIVAGETNSYGEQPDAWLIKTDANGIEQWSDAFGGIRVDRANSVQLTRDGGYIIAGSRTDLYGNLNAWLVKMNEKPAGAEKPLPPIYSPAELRNSTEVPIKYQGEISDEDFNIVLNAAAQKIRTFDNGKYERIRANLSLVGFMMKSKIRVDKFLFELEGYRDNKTESWQMEIEHAENGKNALVTRVSGGGTLVPDKYIDIAKSIALKNLDKEIINRTPEIIDTSPIIDKPDLVVFTFKDPESPAHTIVAVDLKKNTIDSIEKNSWDLNFPIYYALTSNPAGADIYVSRGEFDLCGGGPPFKKRGDIIGKTPITYKYEYTSPFLPYSGLFTLFSFNLTGYEDAFVCDNIGGSASGIYNISVDLKPFDKNKKTRDSEEVSGYVSGIDYLFNWDEIPGNDNWRLHGFLKQMYIADWTKIAKIEKIENGKTINISYRHKYISLGLNDEKTKLNLRTDDNRTYEFNARIEDGKLKIFDTDGISMPEAIVYLEMYDESGFNITIDDSRVGFDEDGIEFVNLSSYVTTSHWFPLHETHAKDGSYSFTGLNLPLENTYRISVKYLGNSSYSEPFNVTGEEKKNFVNVGFGGTAISGKNTSLIAVLEDKKMIAFGIIFSSGILLFILFLRKK